MKAIMIVFVAFRYHWAPEHARVCEQAALPLWMWFIENPRRRID